MYYLTIYQKRAKIKVVETFAPPTNAEIEAELARHLGEVSFDISRKPLEESDFDYRLEFGDSF